jgi:hypothetical protein
MVAASIFMPHPVFQDTISLLKLAMGNPKIKYLITFDFFGLLDAPSPLSTLPSIADFVHSDVMRRRSCLSSEVSVSVIAEALVESRQ